MKSVHTSIIVSAFAILGACASAPPNLDDNLIVPGERIGNVEIGMSLSDLLALKGKPINTIPIPHTEATTYTFNGLTVAAHDEVYWIVARDPRYFTAKGVSMGGEQIYARGAYGEPDCVVTRGPVTVYDYGNIYFEVSNATGLVGEIGVQRETQTCDGR